ncbi:MAG: hypothetical protein K0R98_1110 [Rickettsiaceae bacterium]|nr:hypothetical protein [Rickettsiaceae bacterium]
MAKELYTVKELRKDLIKQIKSDNILDPRLSYELGKGDSIYRNITTVFTDIRVHHTTLYSKMFKRSFFKGEEKSELVDDIATIIALWANKYKSSNTNDRENIVVSTNMEKALFQKPLHSLHINQPGDLFEDAHYCRRYPVVPADKANKLKYKLLDYFNEYIQGIDVEKEQQERTVLYKLLPGKMPHNEKRKHIEKFHILGDKYSDAVSGRASSNEESSRNHR